jgi:hypothetical protein
MRDENSRSSSVDIQDVSGVRSISPSGSSIQRPNRGRMYAKQGILQSCILLCLNCNISIPGHGLHEFCYF